MIRADRIPLRRVGLPGLGRSEGFLSMAGTESFLALLLPVGQVSHWAPHTFHSGYPEQLPEMLIFNETLTLTVGAPPGGCPSTLMEM